MKKIIILCALFVFGLTPLFAQFQDDFSDGDFSTGPAIWTGDAADFIVNPSFELQLNNIIASASYLSSTNNLASLNNLEWRVKVRQTFAPSGSNYGRVYLVSDQANLKNSLNGYYLQFGEAGSLDAVELFRQTGLTSTSVARCTNGLIAASFVVNLKITRDASGNWSIYSDYTGGTTFSLEASGNDVTHNSSTHIGISTVYTISNANKFFYDDFYCGAPILDVTPPAVVSVSPVSVNQLDVLFNEDVELASAQSVLNYTLLPITPGILNATRDAGNFSLVHLSLNGNLSSGQNYTLTVNGVNDIATNPCVNQVNTFTFYNLSTPTPGDLLINELMADPNPVVGQPAAEFVEIYNNNTVSWYNLNGMKLNDAASSGTLTGNYYLGPGDYVILASTSDTALFNTNKKIAVSSFPSLNDAGDNVFLKTASGTTIDSVFYTNSWYKNASKSSGGWSLEKINPNGISPCPTEQNWTASNDINGASPAIQNSVFSLATDVTSPMPISITIIDSMHLSLCFNEALDPVAGNTITTYSFDNGIGNPQIVSLSSNLQCVTFTLSTAMQNTVNYTITFTGLGDCSGNLSNPSVYSFQYIQAFSPGNKELIINEILADYNPPQMLPSAEYIEIYNNSTKYLQLAGCIITDNSSTAVFGNYILAPNNYLLVCDKADTALFSSITNKTGLTSFPSLNDGGDQLELKNNTGVICDSLTYQLSWYRDNIKDDGGYSLELINPNNPIACAISSNWIASNNTNGGTPGVQNSVYNTSPDIIAPLITTLLSSDSNKIQICFSEIISSAQLLNLNNFSLQPGNVNPVTASLISNGQCLELSFANNFISANSYTLQIGSISDCAGNALINLNNAFTYYTPQQYDVVINEIMPDPDPAIGLPNREYVELHNRSAYNISLNNWSIKIGNTTKILSNMQIAADSFIVLSGTGASNDFFNSGLNVSTMEISGFPALLNTGSLITLRNAKGKLMHSIEYDDSWYKDANKEEGGWSLEQMDASNPCAEDINWRASNYFLGGTPGFSNSVLASVSDNSAPELKRVSVISSDSIQLFFSEKIDSLLLTSINNFTIDNGIGNPQLNIPMSPGNKSVVLKLPTPIVSGIIYTCTVSGITDCAGNLINAKNKVRFALPDSASEGDLVINEIMFDPRTGSAEWVEVYNKSQKTFDLAKLNIGDFDSLITQATEVQKMNADGYLLFPGEYVVISENGASVKNEYVSQNPDNFSDITTLPSLSSEDEISISDANGKIIDWLHYSEDFHFPLINETKGVSLERIDFNRSSRDKTNWNSASVQVGYATPAYKNSQYAEAGTGSEVIIDPEIFSPDNDGYQDVLNIHYEFNTSGLAGNIRIFDSRGRLVRTLIKNEILGTSGTYSWNGISDENEKAIQGIYVVLFETTDLVKGNSKRIKKACVLAGKTR